MSDRRLCFQSILPLSNLFDHGSDNLTTVPTSLLAGLAAKLLYSLSLYPESSIFNVNTLLVIMYYVRESENVVM